MREGLKPFIVRSLITTFLYPPPPYPSTPKIIDCYCSEELVFKIPTTALLNVANTLKKLEISYSKYYNINDKMVQSSSDNEIFTPKKYDSTAIDAFQSIIAIISTCHQIEYIRYVNPSAFDSCTSPSSSTISTTNNNDGPLSSSLRHLEIEMGYTETLYEEHIFKRCPHLQILRLKYDRHINVSLLDSIQRYCPRLEYLWFNYPEDLVYGKDLFYQYYPEPSNQNINSNRTTTKVTPPLSPSSPMLKRLYMLIKETDHTISFLNQYADTIEELALSFKSGDKVYFTSLRPMNQLVSLVVTDIWQPFILPTLIPKLPSLQNLELYDLLATSTELIDTLKKVNTLEKLKIHCEPIFYASMGVDLYAYLEIAKNQAVDLFDAFAESYMTTISTATTCSKEEQGNVDDHDLSLKQRHGQRRLTHVSLSGCEFLQDRVLESLGNIKTLSSVFIESAPCLTTKGINTFCEKLNLLPGPFSIELSNVSCVDDSTLSILGSPSIATTRDHDITKIITLKFLDNVTKVGLDQLIKKQGVSVIL